MEIKIKITTTTIDNKAEPNEFEIGFNRKGESYSHISGFSLEDMLALRDRLNKDFPPNL